MSEPTTARLVPPRPNLGPEPWPEPPTAWTGAAIALGSILLGLLLALGILRVRRRSRRRGRPAAGSPEIEPGPATPREDLIRRAERLRSLLVARGDPSWAARTTEELAALPELAARFGPDGTARLVAFLALADRAKFASADAWGAIAAEAVAFPVEDLEAILSPGGSVGTAAVGR